MTLFYTELGVGKSIPMADVKRTSDLSNIDKPVEKVAEPKKAEPEKEVKSKHKKDEIDTIYKKSGDIIVCKFTKKTELSWFYSEEGIGKSIELSDVAKTSSLVKFYTKAQEAVPRPKMPEGCSVSKKSDKSDNSTNYIYEFAAGCKLIKKVIGVDTTYYADLMANGKTEDNYGRGVIVNFKDGTSFERKDVDVTCKRGSGDLYDFTVHFKLSAEEIQSIAHKVTLSYKLYKANRVTGESMGTKMKEGMTCFDLRALET